MQVDGARVQGGVGPVLVGGTEQFPGALDHDRIHVTTACSHVDGTMRRLLPTIVPSLSSARQLAALGHRFGRGANLVGVTEEVELVVAQRHFSCSAAQMRLADVRVRGIDHRGFRRLVEEVVGVVHEVLVERIVLGDEHREGVGVAPPGPPGLLPHRGAGARVAREHGGIERADVDAQLEGARGGDRHDLAGGELALDPAPVLREVAGSVARDPPAQLRVSHLAPGPFREQLGGAARPRERDRPSALAREPPDEPRGFGERAAPDSDLLVDERGVPQSEELLAAR